MQPSQQAIEREFEALRDIRRRSTAQGGPGALLLDPDLPAQPTSSPPLSPQAWVDGKDATVSPTHSRGESTSSEGGGALADDPFHLFWVPAHLHPELAPSEFRAFLKEHARAPAEGGGAASLSRSTSASSTSSLGRKRSMLSRQYRPRDNDGVEEEHVVPLRRNKSIYSSDGPQLTINDLQKLEELADEDPSKLRKVIRRSLSLNVAPSFLDQMDDVPDAGDDADAPIIVPRPNQILRRSARTKIRKPGLAGDGGGHRFPAARRGSAQRSATLDTSSLTSPSDETTSSSGHGEHEAKRTHAPKQKVDEEEDLRDDRRMTYTEETSIYDAYADGPDEEKSPTADATPLPVVTVVERPPSPPPSIPMFSEPSLPPPLQSPTATQPVLHQPQPVRHLTPVIQQQLPSSTPSRSPSPEPTSLPSSFDEPRRPDSRSSVQSEPHSFLSTSPSSVEKRKEKDKKSLWRKVGGGSDKSSKKAGKENKEREKEKEKEKESGFFGSLFGGSKKKHDENAPSTAAGATSPSTATSMLSAKSPKGYTPSVSPQLGNPYARYPIHVERAVYRLSHIKLANPRRPLYEQVLISNLMFWYLGVINKTQQGPGQNQNQQAQEQGQPGMDGQTQGAAPDGVQSPSMTVDKEQREREQKEREREERERAEKEREQREKEQREKPNDRRETRRGSLTKTPAAGSSASAGRRAEMPVKGPQYGLQSQVIEQEYGPGLIGSSMSRTSSAPPPSSQGFGGGYGQRQSPKLPSANVYSQADGNQPYYYGRAGSTDPSSPPLRSTSPPSRSTASGLPPGAMAPLNSGEQLWLGSTPSSNTNSRYNSPSPYQDSDQSRNMPPRPVRSPPPNHLISNDWSRGNDWDAPGNGKLPNRSLSANAAVPAGSGYSNGGLRKKVPSASVAPLDRRQRVSEGGEEEDVPLAVWQQQRRK